ncbi:MAG: hypothetical protein MJ185_02825 [Treponema sp.]|nr:hypothetical protein [Treponema sp.]
MEKSQENQMNQSDLQQNEETEKSPQEILCDLYNSINEQTQRLNTAIEKEVTYTRFLQSEIDRKKYHMEYLELKKTLAEDRAQLNTTLEKINNTLQLRLNDIDNREKSANEDFDGRIQNIEKQVNDFLQIETTIEKLLNQFRTDMTKASTNEFKILKNEYKEECIKNTNSVEDIKNAVLGFLKSCQKQNETLIRKVPSARHRYDWKDFVIAGLSLVWLLGMIFEHCIVR